MASIVSELTMLRAAHTELLKENDILQSHINQGIQENTLLNNELHNLSAQHHELNQQLSMTFEYDSICLREYQSLFRCQYRIQGRVRCRNAGLVLANCGDIICSDCWESLRPHDECTACGVDIVGGFFFNQPANGNALYIYMYRQNQHN